MNVVSKKERNTWGIWQFVISVIISVVVVVMRRRIMVPAEVVFQDRIYIAVGLGSAVFAGWFGYVSYPRVHNFKVFALGLGVAVVSLITMVLTVLLPVVFGFTGGADFFPAVLLLSYLSVLFIFVVTVIVPEYLGYRFTRRMTAVIIGIVVLWYVIGLVVPPVRGFLAFQLVRLGNLNSTAFWGLSCAAATVLFLSLFTEGNSLGIGGIHAGGVLLLSAGWLVPDADTLMHGMIITSLPLLVALGTLIHWFQRLENRASYDPLLRIYNREWCDRVLREQSSLDTRPPCAIGLVDLDHFKQVNDTYGHDAGDTVLREVAQRIRNTVVPHGSVGRFGGEELLVILPRSEEGAARTVFEKALTDLREKPVVYRGQDIGVTASIGFAVRTESGQPLGIVLEAADRAVYVAKDKGRDQIRSGRLTRREE